jgi:endonuclease G
MKFKNLQIITLTLFVLFGSACRKENAPEVIDQTRTAVQFSAAINGQIKTKATDNTWNPGDVIGVFMKNGPGLGNVQSSNKSYTTTGDGEFAATGTEESIYYPENGSTVDFIAYYPYKQTLVNNTYSVDVNNQNNQAAIDLLYADNANGLSKTNANANLIFTHKLAKVEFTVKNGTGVSDLNGLEVKIAGVKMTANFDLATGVLTATGAADSLVAKTTVKNNLTVAEAILVPSTDENETKVIFSLGTKTFTWTLPASTKFEEGKKYIYEIELKGDGSGIPRVAAAIKATIINWSDVPSGSFFLDQEQVSTNPPVLSGYMETPLITTDENTVYIAHGFPGRANVRNYSMLYDKKYKMAYWVAYPLHASYIGSSGRSDAWGFDPAIAQSAQVNLSSSFGGGYDRGHQLPSGDRTATRDLNATTFYYSNMTAQVSSMNQGIWNNLEQQVRTWMAQSDTLYVVTGAGIKTASDQTITYSKGSAIPKYYYKALAMKKGDNYYTIAFRIDNKIIPSGTNYNSYRVNVSDLEKETGFNFFPKLAKEAKETIDNTIWK